jgi:hypothetical protein
MISAVKKEKKEALHFFLILFQEDICGFLIFVAIFFSG